MLEQEVAYYQEQLPDLLEKHEGKTVLIKNQEIVGIFVSNDEALREGMRRFGLQNFLVRPVLAHQQEVKIPALSLGILRANSQHTI